MWSQLHHCDGLFQNRQWHWHINDLFEDSLWAMLLARELRLQTTVFAGAVSVTQRITRLPFLYRLLRRRSLRPSMSKTVCFLFSVLSYAERIFLSIWISLYFVMQSSCCHCTEAVGHPSFSVPSGSQAPALPRECPQCSVRDPPWWQQRPSARRTTSRLSLAAELTETRSPLCDFIAHLLQAERMCLHVHDL